MTLDKFLKAPKLLAALRKGVLAMKKRKPSDPLSWWFQAAVHGEPKEMVAEWMKTDPDVAKVDQAKFWNQCPRHGENSANFLPWHRGYTHYFEQILRMHTGVVPLSNPDHAIRGRREHQIAPDRGPKRLAVCSTAGVELADPYYGRGHVKRPPDPRPEDPETANSIPIERTRIVVEASGE